MEKRGMTIAVLLSMVICLCGCTAAEKETKVEPTIHWTEDFTMKYQEDPDVNQLIAVQYTGGYDAKIQLFEKSVVEGKNVWTKTLTCDGIVGKNGLGKTKEGDLKTPIGDFGVTTAFGIKENPGTSMPYIDVTEDTYCCADENYYNQIIDISEHPHDCSDGEHMITYSPQYNYGMFLDYNKEGEPGKGSAIFFHCFGANPYTGGCIAVSEEDMMTILKSVDEGVRVVIDYMP